jgi:hypothetical protein
VHALEELEQGGGGETVVTHVERGERLHVRDAATTHAWKIYEKGV